MKKQTLDVNNANNNNKNNLNKRSDAFGERRSITYSGEEFANIKNVLQQSKNSNTNLVKNKLGNLRSASLQEQTQRRTNFSRKNYGLSELCVTLDREGIIQNIGKFRIENGDANESLNISNTIHLENPESQTRWYFKYFLGKLHRNYVVEDKTHEIYFLSIVITDLNDRHIPQYKVILWTKQGSLKLTLCYQQNKNLSVKQIIPRFQIECDRSPREILDPSIQNELLVLEEQEGSVNFKFGIIYAKYGQLTDDEMLSNEHGSQEFEDFLNLIGNKIKLKNWRRYRGGLDTNTSTTGDYSVYTIYEGHEIMFHVSTLLPYAKDSKQQLERKRHIGNDIVTIVFQDVDENQEPDFTPSSARSQFQHIFALITFNKNEKSYKLRVFSEQSVPPFGPSLPSPPVFTNHQEFREFLLVKLINGEKAAFNNSVFGKRKKRTIESIIQTMYENYDKDALSFLSKKRDDQRKEEFLRIGQNLKLQTVIKGDAPTSQLTTSINKREIWEPNVFLQSFESPIICSDSWNDWLIVGSKNGIFMIDETIPWDIRKLFDKSILPRQLDICETFGLMILLLEKGRVCVFRLEEINSLISDKNFDLQTNAHNSKAFCKEHKIDSIQNCSFYTTNKHSVNTNENFRLAAICGKKIQIYQLNYQELNEEESTSITCEACSTNIANVNCLIGISLFKIKREFNCIDTPNLVNLIDMPSQNKQYILVSNKYRIEIMDEISGDTVRTFPIAFNSNLTSINELYDNDQLEFLLTHNCTSEFLRFDDPQKQEDSKTKTCLTSKAVRNSYFYFQWNTEPNHILCVFPYVIGISNQSIEIRLLVNGNLVHSITMSNIKMLAHKKDIYFSSSDESFTLTEFTFNDKNIISYSPSDIDYSNALNEISNTGLSTDNKIISPKKDNCTIYKISLDFLSQNKSNEKFVFNQLCEDSYHNIQRETTNSNFLITEQEEHKLSTYMKIIESKIVNDDFELQTITAFEVKDIQDNIATGNELPTVLSSQMDQLIADKISFLTEDTISSHL